MRIFIELVFLPLIVNILSNVFAEWLISKAENESDKHKQ
ncbi:hypothetical protein Si089_01715 [Streptococcus infantarius subsp. infantarius]|nr:hypothetical protein [Streptococcus infantarius subsp. infantarius]MCO4559360.1 hypothetical protein [Streptococcus infantarius subsp. infantarius]MCO4565039.1 hypothetical protein [Streptococcus infantarius subsp. infantarius]MCO4576487.1 hypothetical protein [Streptococcus infantarius subsp. infantarius]